jgi:monoamine oxidase
MTGVSRREVVTGAASAAAGALLGAAASAGVADAADAAGRAGAAASPRKHGKPAHRKADVIVIGAGLAGLSAASDLVRAGHSAVVLEARARVGGRTLNHPVGHGEVIEVGGEWVGPGQDRIIARAKEFGIKTFKTYTKGAQILDYEGKQSHFTGLIPPLPSPDAADFGQLLGKVITLQATVPLTKPWTAPNAATLDSQTVQTYMDDNSSTTGAQFLIGLAVKAILATDPRDVSLLHALFYFQSGNGVLNLASTSGGAQDSRFVGGSQLVSIEMGKRLGDRVVLDAPARRIEQTRNRVAVETDGGTWHGKAVIVAMSPMLAGRIEYDPVLPALRDGLTQRVPNGSAIKYEAVFPKPFWRSAGLNGYANSDRAPIHLTYDNSPPSGKPGVLLGFVLGEDARALGALPWAKRRRAVLDAFVRLFGAQAAKPTELIEHNWSEEPWTRGCYAGYMPPGVWSDFGSALRAPIGRIHWAGTETSEVFAGYMDGAVRSGERAASEVAARL